MNLSIKTLSKLSVQATSLSIQAVMQVLTLMVFARYINPEEFGIFAIASLVQNFADLFASGGISSALVQRKELDNKHIMGALFFVLLISVVLYIIIYISSDLIAQFYHKQLLSDVLKYASISLIILGATSIPRAILQRNLQFKKIMVADIVPYFIGYIIVGISLAIKGFGVWTLVGAILTTAVLKLFMFFSITRLKIQTKGILSGVKELLFFGGGITVLRLINALAQYMDKILVGKLLSLEALGLYERVAHIVLLMSKYLGNTFDSVLFPILSGIQDEKDRLRMAFLKAAELLNTLVIPFVIFMVFHSHTIIYFLLGDAWLPADFVFKILLILPVIRLITRLSDSLVRSLGALYRSALRKFGFVIAIVTGLISGAQYGLNGVAVGVLAAVFVHFALMLNLSLSLIDVSLYRFLSIYKNGLRLGLLACVISGFSYITSMLFLGWANWVQGGLFVFDLLLLLLIVFTFPHLLGDNMIMVLTYVIGKVPRKFRLIHLFQKRLSKIKD